jgi:putative transposase
MPWAVIETNKLIEQCFHHPFRIPLPCIADSFDFLISCLFEGNLLLTDGQGVPLGVVVAGANRHDMKLVTATLESILVKRPEAGPQHICLDKGYDYPQVRELVELWGYTAHIRSPGEEKLEQAAIPGYRVRRWVVERTHSWLNRFRRLLTQWKRLWGTIWVGCIWLVPGLLSELLELSDRL